MIYVYNAGPLFKEGEIVQRRYEASVVKQLLEKYKREYFICNPIDLPFDNSLQLTASEIFIEDYRHLNSANVCFFELASGDEGTMVELGNIIEKIMQGKKITIYPVFADLRLQRNGASGVECPIGFNSYLVGCLKANNITIYMSFNDALLQFEKDLPIENLT